MFDELISPLLTTVWGRRASLTAFIAMIVILVITVIATIISWHADANILQNATLVQLKLEPSNSEERLIPDISTWHLFGANTSGSEVLPITSLQLHLMGVYQATPQQLSTVIISEENQPGKVYRVGDRLAVSGVKVYSISQDGVILENGGRLEKLLLNRSPLPFKGMPDPLLK